MKFKTLAGMLAIVDAWPWLIHLQSGLAELKLQKLGATLDDAETSLVVQTPFQTLKEKLTQVRSEALFDRLVNRVCK